LMVSDGRLSRQALGYDHDATRAGSRAAERSQATQKHDEREGDETARSESTGS
jgi:hypothetical protein